MNTYFDDLDMKLTVEDQILQTLLNVGYPAGTSVIGSEVAKEDELPWFRDFKAAVQPLMRYFPTDTDIDPIEIGKLIFLLYHHCIVSATDTFRSLAYWTDTNTVTTLSRMDCQMGLDELLDSDKFEIDSAGNFVGENTKKQREWKDISCTIPMTPENSNKAKVLRQNATYIKNRLHDSIFGGCINNLIGWYSDFPLLRGYKDYQFYYNPNPDTLLWNTKERYTYSFPAANTDIAYDLLYNYRGYITAWFKFLDDVNDESTTEKDAVKGISKLYRYHQKLEFHTTENNTLDDLLYINKMESNFSIAYIPQIINLRHAVNNMIASRELLEQIILESVDLGNGLYRLDLLIWVLRNYLGITYNATSGEAELLHAEKNTIENASKALTFMKTCQKILFPVSERLFFKKLYNRNKNFPGIPIQEYCKIIYRMLGDEIRGKNHAIYLTRILNHSDKYAEFFNALQVYFLDINSDQQITINLIDACHNFEETDCRTATNITPHQIEEKSRKGYEDWKFIADVFIKTFDSSKSSEQMQGFITPSRLGFGIPEDEQTYQKRIDLQKQIDYFLLS